MYLPLALVNMYGIARQSYLLRREFLVVDRGLIALALAGQFASRFPNPIPSGTRLPQWALLDVTVRS
jgi:hypothetical protein